MRDGCYHRRVLFYQLLIQEIIRQMVKINFGDPEEDRRIVDRLCKIGSGLNDWEMDFIDDVSERVIEKGLGLSVGQKKKAYEILGKYDA